MADWSVLPRDILILIVGRLETSFEIVLFQSVCSSWRSAVPSPRDSRCLGIKTHITVFVHHRYIYRGKPRFNGDDKCCTLKKIPVYLVRFNTPFGDDYLLAEMRERRNSGKPMSMSSPLISKSWWSHTQKHYILLFNSLTTQIVSLSHYYYQLNLEELVSFSLRTGVKWDSTSKTVEYLELNNEDCRDFRLLWLHGRCGYMGAFGANLESLLSCGVVTSPNPANSIYDLFSDSIWLTKEKD
ncbi:PREDICTED: F-box protein At2g16300-like [Camelina sativa]|uniref:F-box protein At2g16300-like n=1 Tax=Camelina sativa TaxID=90675 RepID=A0ABM1QZW8_CAMSA|nr:PREDICTED: F-box protein At2g16300-like [Camelina sativa]